jgi:hypothetical protein
VPKEALELAGFVYEGRFRHSDNWRAPGPGTRADRTPVQFSAEDVGIADAVARAQVIDVEAGLRLRVGTASDLVILKLAAAEEPRGRRSKRQQDLADVTRLAEEHPEVSKALPDIEQRIATIGTTIFSVKLDVDVDVDVDDGRG